MKIYFGFTVAGDRSSVQAARAIVTALEAQGHHVLTRHLVTDGARDSDRQLGAREVYERDLRWLEECDCFIAEVSGSSFGLGYETGYVLGATTKRAVLFYRREAAPRISLMITGNTHQRCTLVPYDTVEELEAYAASCLRGG